MPGLLAECSEEGKYLVLVIRGEYFVSVKALKGLFC